MRCLEVLKWLCLLASLGRLQYLPWELEGAARDREVWASLLRLVPCDLDADKLQDGWKVKLSWFWWKNPNLWKVKTAISLWRQRGCFFKIWWKTRKWFKYIFDSKHRYARRFGDIWTVLTQRGSAQAVYSLFRKPTVQLKWIVKTEAIDGDNISNGLQL